MQTIMTASQIHRARRAKARGAAACRRFAHTGDLADFGQAQSCLDEIEAILQEAEIQRHEALFVACEE